MRYYLTEQEKREIRNQYLENVRTINKYLSRRNKISTSLSDLNRKLNNPDEQRKYKKALEIQNDVKKRKEIFDKLASKYQKIPGREYLLERTLQFLIDVRPGAEKYNEAIVKTYFEHPEATAQYYFQKAMELNPGDILKISKCDDMENLLYAYYEKNRALCDFAFCLKDAYPPSNPEFLNDEAQKYFSKMCSSYETICNAGNLAKSYPLKGFFVPILNDRQQNELFRTKFFNDQPELNVACGDRKTQEYLSSILVNDLKNFSKEIEKGHYNIDRPGGMSYYVCRNKATNKIESFEEKLRGEIKDDCEFITLDEETAKNVRKIYRGDYIALENVKFPKPLPNDEYTSILNEFRYRYAMNNNKHLYKLEENSLYDMVKNVRRGFFEFMFQSTTDYTKNLKTALSDYENPRSADFRNSAKLKEVAQAYLDHKNVKTRDDVNRLSSSGKNRSLICLDLIAAIDANKKVIEIKEKDIENDKDDSVILINENGKNKTNELEVDPDEILRAPIDADNISLKNDIEEKADNNISIIKDDIKIDNSIENEEDNNIDLMK